MNVTVFGASGGIGAHLVVLAAEHGHQVRAVYRTAPPQPFPVEAEILLGADIFDQDFVTEAIRGADVVVRVVGPNFVTRHNPRTRMTSRQICISASRAPWSERCKLRLARPAGHRQHREHGTS